MGGARCANLRASSANDAAQRVAAHVDGSGCAVVASAAGRGHGASPVACACPRTRGTARSAAAASSMVRHCAQSSTQPSAVAAR
eukprot:scaffold128477_cov69-Phaeocystis_antarctica.AAC.2